ncbi:hypothetical protein ACFL54_08395, partial [Planctomycetota bacterium]
MSGNTNKDLENKLRGYPGAVLSQDRADQLAEESWSRAVGAHSEKPLKEAGTEFINAKRILLGLAAAVLLIVGWFWFAG